MNLNIKAMVNQDSLIQSIQKFSTSIREVQNHLNEEKKELEELESQFPKTPLTSYKIDEIKRLNKIHESELKANEANLDDQIKELVKMRGIKI